MNKNRQNHKKLQLIVLALPRKTACDALERRMVSSRFLPQIAATSSPQTALCVKSYPFPIVGMDLDHSGSGSSIVASWHPALRPDNDEQLRAESIQHVPDTETEAVHDLNSDLVEKPADDTEGKDISALWEAVLDDDDLLADDSDGLLPDSSPLSSPDSPSSFLESLHNGTSFQEPDEVVSRYDTSSLQDGTHSTSNQPGGQLAGRQTLNPYTPHQPSSSDLAQMSPTTYGRVGLSRPGLAPLGFGQNLSQGHLQRPSAPPKAESFVDQSKGGYKSPYDLPMDLSKPRKRVQMHQPPPVPKVPAAPPRSMSVTSDQRPSLSAAPLKSPFAPANTTFEGQARPPSSQNFASLPPVGRGAANGQQGAPKAKASSSSFFEELPISAKPRPPTAQGRYTPVQSGPLPSHVPAQISPGQHLPPSTNMPPPPIPNKSSTNSYSQYQLQQPERLDPYANIPIQSKAAPVISNSRYSPAPPTSQTAPPLSRYSQAPPSSHMAPPPGPSRYSPAPPPQPNVLQTQNRYASQPQLPPQARPPHTASQSLPHSQPMPQIPTVLPFQPRTSSPLAYHGHKSIPQVPEADMSGMTPPSPPTRVPAPQHTPPQVESPPSSEPPVFGQDFAPPRRSQTQSPGKRGPVSSLITSSNDLVQRPASVHGPSSPVTSANPYQAFPPARPSARQRGFSQNLKFVPQTDETQHDMLQRWRGSPIVRFGLAGSVLSNFPKHVPRYTAGSTLPMIKPMSGEVQLRNAKEMLPVEQHVAKFPGPLKSKSKKKEVLAWLADRIAALETLPLPSYSQQLPDPVKKHDEKVLLWKVVRVMVEHDGVVEGNAEMQKAINLILSPASVSPQDIPVMHGRADADATEIYKPQGVIPHNHPTDPAAVESVRKSLIRGEREKAVWTAVDNRLWAHAMLLSSTLDRSIWKQVAHEFVRQEVKLIGANTEPLGALYEVLAGNLEESVDELVPPSARAGLQMVSKVDSAGPTKSALGGLDKWRETLSLVLNNRTAEDHKALAALGRLLASYGRTEASHICHLFANSPVLPSVFGGADDPQASIVLLGADHLNQPNKFFLDEDAVLLTEIYEFVTCVLASSSKSTLPHLQAYKLQRAKSLAESGFKSEAQAYCDAVGTSLRSTTKLSPYYHPQFLAELDDLTQRLSQAPTQTSSWISKPTMGKVTDSMWNKFTNFVAGDDSDGASTGSGKDAGHEFGPFAKVTGTPTVSRSGSISDLYGSYQPAAPQTVPNTIAGSRYAPSGQYSARSSSELTRGRASLDSQRSPSYLPTGSVQKSPYDPNASLTQQSYMSPPVSTQSASPWAPIGASPLVQPTQATSPQTYMPTVQPDGQISSYKSRQSEPYVPTPPPEQSGPYMSTGPIFASPPAQEAPPAQQPIPYINSYAPPQAESQASAPPITPSYQPTLQSYSSYEPPSTEYVPYQPDPESDPESEKPKPKKKSFIDDDDHFPSFTSAAQNKPATDADSDAASAAARKKANDEAAEAAFRAAAEADAAKDKQGSKGVKPKSSWFSLFSRNQTDSLDSPSSNKTSSGTEGTKVIRAKLGEESSFYYDKELKKWVNKKDPASMQARAKATPPPPKGPVGRVVSQSLSLGGGPATGPPPTPPPPAVTSPALGARPSSSTSNNGAGPPSRNGTPESAPPPSVPGMGGSNALAPPMAPPTSRPASAALSTASDIDDLLGAGPPAPRKTAGTLKGKKGRAGAGRYVDVMAK